MNFNFIDNIDIVSLKEKVLSSDSLWVKRPRVEKDPLNSVQRDTFLIPIKWEEKSMQTGIESLMDEKIFESLNISPFLEKLYQILNKTYGDGIAVRIMITKLPPDCKIYPHHDTGFSLKNAHRIHIPLQSHPSMIFNVDDEIISMKEGEIWEIDNTKLHSVENNSSIDRIHFIIDYQTIYLNIIKRKS